jgi:hypothetical protein
MNPEAERDAIRDRLIEHAHNDPGIVGAALVGSTATGGDRWSDLDLTFAVAPNTTIESALERWTSWIETEFGGVKLVDLPIPGTIYRVYLFPGALQVDLSFSEQGVFGSRSPRFELIFGEPVHHPYTVIDASPADTFGWAVHHLVRARVCIERGLVWQADYWIRQARDSALTLACLGHGIEARHGKGFDKLPPEVTARYLEAITHSLEPVELRRSLAVVTRLTLEEAQRTVPTTAQVATMLASLSA